MNDGTVNSDGHRDRNDLNAAPRDLTAEDVARVGMALLKRPFLEALSGRDPLRVMRAARDADYELSPYRWAR